jgi:hypothetical protein
MSQLTFWSEEPHANHSQSQDSEADWLTRVATWPSDSYSLLLSCSPAGSFGKTCRASSVAAKDGILEPSSGRWANSGMGSPTEFLTLNGLESPSVAAVCSLSATLETGDVPQRYFLSEKACSGILRRAERRGKMLPAALATALHAASQQERPSDKIGKRAIS